MEGWEDETAAWETPERITSEDLFRPADWDRLNEFWMEVLDDMAKARANEVKKRILAHHPPQRTLPILSSAEVSRESMISVMEQVMADTSYKVCHPNPFHVVSPNADPTKPRHCANCGATIPPILED